MKLPPPTELTFAKLKDETGLRDEDLRRAISKGWIKPSITINTPLLVPEWQMTIYGKPAIVPQGVKKYTRMIMLGDAPELTPPADAGETWIVQAEVPASQVVIYDTDHDYRDVPDDVLYLQLPEAVDAVDCVFTVAATCSDADVPTKFDEEPMANWFYLPQPMRMDEVVARCFFTIEEVTRFKNSFRTESENQKEDITARERTTLLNIIAGLLALVQGEIDGGPNDTKRLSDAKIISLIGDHFDGYPGLSKRTLEDKFKEARKIHDRI